MKKIYALCILSAVSVSFLQSCRGDNVSSQKDIVVPDAKSYMQVDGGERLQILKVTKKWESTGTAATATAPATPNKVKITIEANRTGTNENHTLVFAIEYPYGSEISGPYSPQSYGKKLDKDLSSYAYTEAGNSYGPYSDLLHGGIQISKTGANTYDLVFSMSPSYGPKPITGKYSGEVSGN